MSERRPNIEEDLRMQGKLCDVSIEVKGGMEFLAHKIILCKQSGFFRDLFTGVYANLEDVQMSDIEPDIMETILDYIYGTTVNITQQKVEDLLFASEFLKIVGLKQLCCDFLKNNLRVRNCISIRKIAETYTCSDLHRQAQHFLLHKFHEVSQFSTEFLELERDDLCKIIKSDDLNVNNESFVFDAIIRWIEHDEENRKPSLAVLLSLVRMGLLDKDDFNRTVKHNEFVRRDSLCKPVLAEAIKAMKMRRESNPELMMARPRLPSEMLLAVGGCTSESPTSVIEVYNIRANRWKRFPLESSARVSQGVAYLDGFVYCFGGFDGREYLNAACRLDVTLSTWKELLPMHYPRGSLSVAVLDGCIYAIGGYDGVDHHKTSERFKPEICRWDTIAPMQEGRSQASATTLNGKMYICGGLVNNEVSYTAMSYDPRTDQWTSIPSMDNARSRLGVVAYKDQIFAVGGFDGTNNLQSIEAYNPKSNTWKEMSSMPTPLSDFGIAVLEEMLVIVGGTNNGDKLCNLIYYDGETGAWQDGKKMPTSRDSLSCCVVPQCLVDKV